MQIEDDDHAGIEQIGLQEYLAIGDGNHIGRNIGRYVASLGLDDRQRRQRSAAMVVVHLRRAFQQPRMQIEDVARIGLAAGRSAQQERHLPVGDRLLGQIVIDDQRMLAVIAEPFAHRTAGIGGEILHRRRLGGRSGDDDRVFHRAVIFQRLDDLSDGRALLPNRDIDAEKLFILVVAIVIGFLIENGVDGDRGLSSLTVTDDQLALAAADRDQAVDRLETGLHRLGHRFAWNNSRRLHVDTAAVGPLDRTLAVDRIAKTVDHPAEQRGTDRHVDDGAGPLDGVAFLDRVVVTEDHDADIVGLQIERHTDDPSGEFDEFARLNIVQPVNSGDAIADR